MVGGMDALPLPPASAEPSASAQWAWALIQHRQTILPKRLDEPGPDERQLELILQAAAAAPDHGELLPWRFVLIPAAARARCSSRPACGRPSQDWANKSLGSRRRLGGGTSVSEGSDAVGSVKGVHALGGTIWGDLWKKN